MYPSPLHFIHVEPILSASECDKVLELARAHASLEGRWDRPDSERHATYATCDFPIDECSALADFFEEIEFDDRIFGAMTEKYGVEDLAYLDFFCVNYSAKSDDFPERMDRLEAHRDGSLLSFTITLNDDYEGGGTFFEALRYENDEDPNRQKNGVVKPAHRGEAVLHSGKILHGADPVRKGDRTVLVGFVEVGEWCQRPGALGAACREWGRMDLATKRYERQVEKGARPINIERWMPQSNEFTGKSYLVGYCPKFASVERRADPEWQRTQRLRAEDHLLRGILLPEDERGVLDEVFLDGDVSLA